MTARVTLKFGLVALLRETVEDRPCTCHPDDRPPTCQKLYAASQCQASARAKAPARKMGHGPACRCAECENYRATRPK